MTKAMFPGSFDPFTSGHLNILERALTIFDTVIVAIGVNQDKNGFYSVEQKMDIIRQATKGMKGVEVEYYDGLTVDACKQFGVRHIVRGVRNFMDFEVEQSNADANKRLYPEVDTLIIPTAQEYSHISSSAVRDIIRHGGDTGTFMPEGVILPRIDV